MNIREYAGFQIEMYPSGVGYIAEVYRKGKLQRTIRDESGGQELPFQSVAVAFEAAKSGSIARIPERSNTKGIYKPPSPFINSSGWQN